MQCLNCGQTVGEEDAFCPNCGVDIARPTTRVFTRRVCGSCGQTFSAPQDDGTDRCSECQTRHASRQQSEEERREREKEKLQQSERAGLRSQRKAGRFAVPGCFVRVRRIGMTAVVLRRDNTHAGALIDLSTTGLQCVAEGDFGKGDPVGLQLLVPAFNNPLSLRGIVRWAEDEGSGRMRLGVQFDAADEKTAAHLTALEKHPALRDAAQLLEEKRNTRTLKKTETERPRERPNDF